MHDGLVLFTCARLFSTPGVVLFVPDAPLSNWVLVFPIAEPTAPGKNMAAIIAVVRMRKKLYELYYPLSRSFAMCADRVLGYFYD